MEPNDSVLAARAATGDAAAFGRLVERYGATARRVALGVLDDPEDADDAAQEGFLAAWQRLDRFRPDRPFRPWLLKIVLNAARDLRRKRKVRRVWPLKDDVPSRGGTPEETTDQALLRDALGEALRQLPERQRVAVLMHDAEGFTHAEVAVSLGCPEGTARSLLFHGRRKLRRALGEVEPTRPSPGPERPGG